MLVGYYVCADMIKGQSKMVEFVNQQQLFLMAWITDNNLENCVTWQKSHGGTAIIRDR